MVLSTLWSPQYRYTLKYMNLGGNSFSKSVKIGDPYSSSLLSLADVDNDRDLDLIVYENYSRLQWFRNDGGELYQGATISYNSVTGFCVEDFDDDGDFDVVEVGNGRVSLYKYDAGLKAYKSEALSGVSGSGYSNCLSGDFDNNGYLDLVLTKGQGDNELYLNDGNEFVPYKGEDFAGILGTVSMAAADYDRNGFLDFMLTNSDYGTRRHMFRGLGNSNHWLRVKLVGKESNRDGLGVKVKIVNPGRVQLREIRSISGSYSANEQIAHFGLGSETVVEYLKIEWPSGKDQWIANPYIDSLLVIEEGDGIIPQWNIETPSQLTATLIPDLKATLQWNDNSDLETTYILERSVNGAPFETYKVLPANTVSFTDDFNAMEDKQYVIRYRVVAAFDEIQSQPSNIADITFDITGIESQSDFLVSIYPNPVDRTCVIESERPIHSISIYDASGLHLRDVTSGGVQNYEMSVANLADGVYVLKLRTSSAVIVRKIIVRKGF